MKRSQVNAIIGNSEAFLRGVPFYLPPFAAWSPQDWQDKLEDCRGVVAAGLGWDVTDFGLGDFANKGVVLFTIRNGVLGGANGNAGSKTYCEKILICQPNQLVMHHFHKSKTEDIINRAGGDLELVLYNSDAFGGLDTSREVRVCCDGLERVLPPGGRVVLRPGESITLTPHLYHQFQALEATVLVGEVSSVNDDHNDNFFLEPLGRFPSIQEDEAPQRLLVGDCAGLGVGGFPKTFHDTR